MANKDTLRKLGVVRSGTVSGTYKNAKDRPTELQMDDVYDAEKDLVGGDKTKKDDNNLPPSNSKKTNPLAIIGFILAFFLPLIGFILSLIGLTQINKKKESGKGLAIAGIVVSCVVAVLHLILTMAIVAAVLSSDNVTLKEYNDTSVGYTVKYPEGWTISPQAEDGAKGVIINDKYKDTGKVYGQVEVAHIDAPPNGYSKDVLVAISDALKNDNAGTVVNYESRQKKNGVDSITLIATYNGESGKVKAKHTIILNKDNSVYTVSTQSPEENWEKYQDSFDEIHNTFNF
jgi:hypothetical protein